MPVVCVLAGYARVALMDPVRIPHEDRPASANIPNPGGVVPEKPISGILLYWPGDEAAMRELRRRVYVNTMVIAPRALGRGNVRPRGGGDVRDQRTKK